MKEVYSMERVMVGEKCYLIDYTMGAVIAYNEKGKYVGSASFVDVADFDFDTAVKFAVHQSGSTLNKEEKKAEYIGMHAYTGKKHNKKVAVA